MSLYSSSPPSWESVFFSFWPLTLLFSFSSSHLSPDGRWCSSCSLECVLLCLGATDWSLRLDWSWHWPAALNGFWPLWRTNSHFAPHDPSLPGSGFIICPALWINLTCFLDPSDFTFPLLGGPGTLSVYLPSSLQLANPRRAVKKRTVSLGACYLFK